MSQFSGRQGKGAMKTRREIKRLEAEERNAKTPEVRRKAFRRAFTDENGTVPNAVPAGRKKRSKTA